MYLAVGYIQYVSQYEENRKFCSSITHLSSASESQSFPSENLNWLLLNHNCGSCFIYVISFVVYVDACNECIDTCISNFCTTCSLALLFNITDTTLLMKMYECLDSRSFTGHNQKKHVNTSFFVVFCVLT